MILLFLFLALAIIVSFLCSIAEAVLLSVRPAYVTAQMQKKRAGARALEKLQNNLDRPLAAILILNTVAHTVGAAGVGAQAAVVFGNNYLAATSAVLTLLVLVLSEIIPKTLGAAHWQRMAPTTAVALVGLTRALLPLVWLSEKLTKLISPNKGGAIFSREEMTAMAQIGVEEGLLDDKEQVIVGNLMRLHKLAVSDIMTPRAVMFMADKARTVADFLAEHAESPFTRIPIYGDNRDDVVGYVLKQDLYVASARSEGTAQLEAFKRMLPLLPESLNASHAFDKLMRERSHIALVVDEFGSVKGLVTLEDVMETLLGLEITDELDTVEDMQHLARERWRDRMSALGIDPKEWPGS